MHALVAGLLALQMVACRDGANSAAKRIDPPVEPPRGDSVRISAMAPSRNLPIPADAIAAVFLRVAVTNVRNPDHRGVDLSFSVQSDSAASASVGRISLFPVDSGGVFTLRVPDDARAAIQKAFTTKLPVRLNVELNPGNPGDPDRRELTIASFEWLERST
jgi:hypothetical protein